MYKKYSHSSYFTRFCNLTQQWALKKGISLNFIQPGKPTQNAYIESFNGKFRTEFLDQHWFSTITEVKHETNKWRKNYNEARPHIDPALELWTHN